MLLLRYTHNPILTSSQWPYPINSVFNPGATILADGRTLLLCRCEDFEGRSHFCNATSDNGYSAWNIDNEPCLSSERDEECFGIEDPRITWLPEKECYAVVYTSVGVLGPGVSIALTKDFHQWERLGQVFFAENKDAFLLSERINGHWLMIHRPVIAHGHNGSIWLSSSPDLIHWGNHRCIMQGRGGTYWDSGRLGASCPLIKTDDGLLMIYHSGKGTPSGSIYRCGLALLSSGDPGKVLCRSKNWFFGPSEEYERIGDVNNVVFICGCTVVGEEVRIYYGAADTCIGVATCEISELLSWLHSNKV